MNICFIKFALLKKKKLHKFPSPLWHICKMCNPFFLKVANCATFQKAKKKPYSHSGSLYQVWTHPIYSKLRFVNVWNIWIQFFYLFHFFHINLKKRGLTRPWNQLVGLFTPQWISCKSTLLLSNVFQTYRTLAYLETNVESKFNLCSSFLWWIQPKPPNHTFNIELKASSQYFVWLEFMESM